MFAFPASCEQYIAVIFLRNYFINTTSKVDVVSVIHEINRCLRESKATEGLATVSVPAPGAGVTVVEPLPGIVDYLKEAATLFPGEGAETKNRRKEEVSVGPRIAAAMLGKTLSLPFSGGRLLLGPREEVVLVDFETEGRRREFNVQIMGEEPAAAKGPVRRR